MVARPLHDVEVRELQSALSEWADAYREAKPTDAMSARRHLAREGVARGLLTALAEGRICIEQVDEPTADEVRDDLELISDAHWEALKEDRL